MNRRRFITGAIGGALVLGEVLLPGKRLGLQTAMGTAVCAPSPGYSADRWVYSFGSPTFDTDGWIGDSTENHWDRQGDPATLASRVFYDDAVTVMQNVLDSNGQPCHTMREEIQPTDKDANGGTTNQRGQVIWGAPTMQRGGWPDMGIVPGETHWYGFAFQTNSGFTPHYDATFGNFNVIQAFHNSGAGPLAPFEMEIDTIGPADDSLWWKTPNPTFKQLASPRLGWEINGGRDDSPNWSADNPTDLTVRRYLGPVFVPGHLYRVQYKITWGQNFNGAIQIWLDDTMYWDIMGVCNMWYHGLNGFSNYDTGMYFELTHYRAYDTGLPTNEMYHGGIIKGSTRYDVTVP